jgi:hypothetical protein
LPCFHSNEKQIKKNMKWTSEMNTSKPMVKQISKIVFVIFFILCFRCSQCRSKYIFMIYTIKLFLICSISCFKLMYSFYLIATHISIFLFSPILYRHFRLRLRKKLYYLKRSLSLIKETKQINEQLKKFPSKPVILIFFVL